MADRSIESLDAATVLTNSDLFLLSQSSQAKKTTWSMIISYLTTALDGHGGISSIAKTGSLNNVDTYRITYADNTVSTFTVTNGTEISGVTQYWAVSDSASTAPSTWYTTMQTLTVTDRYLWGYTKYDYNDGTHDDTTPCVIGVYGDTGEDWYVYFRWASQQPTSDAQLKIVPDKWIGVYSGTSAEPPTSYADYVWYQYKGDKGDTGTAIVSVTKTGTSGLVDTYTVAFSNNTTTTFQVRNGSNIQSIAKTGTSGLVDTYTVTLTDGTTSTFTVTNAKSITSIEAVDVTHASGHSDVYRINFNDNDTYEFTIYNGVNGTGAVSTVDGIESSNQDVTLLTLGTGAPTTATVGAIKSRYFDTANSRLYICIDIDTSGGTPTYTWAGAGVTVDASMSTTSTNPVRNSTLTGIIGTDTMNTTATTLKGAVNELKSSIETVAASTKHIKATNVSVAVNAWTTPSSPATPEYEDFPWKAAISITGVTASMFPDVVYDVDDVKSGNFAPVADTGSGVVYIYAAEKPEAVVTIPSILCVL